MDTYFQDFQCLTPEQVRKLYSTNKHYKLRSPFENPTHDIDQLMRGLRINFPSKKSNHPAECPVCFEQPHFTNELRRLECGHSFCTSCWRTHLEMQLNRGITTRMECMDTDCKTLVPEHFALHVLKNPNLREKYNQFALRDCVRSHPELRFCPGLNCSMIIRAKKANCTRVTCISCRSVFCFKCGCDFHAPADCEMMKKWNLKCGDDVQSRNYLQTKAKACPTCCYYIEKISGCNSVRCPNCKHDFCWLCLGSHEASLRCNRLRLNSNQVETREEVDNYRLYFDRWENQRECLVFDEARLVRIRRKATRNGGCLMEAAATLVRCRSALKYACVVAYFMAESSRKESFEYQQRLLEVGIEKLAYKIEKSDGDGRDLGHQVAVCENLRTILLNFGH